MPIFAKLFFRINERKIRRPKQQSVKKSKVKSLAELCLEYFFSITLFDLCDKLVKISRYEGRGGGGGEPYKLFL